MSIKRIVLKFGTGILTQAEANTLDHRQIERLSSEVAAVVKSGVECLVVSSGAVGAGLMTLGLSERPESVAGVQACAAVGQCKLMQMYETAFGDHGLFVGQLLLTHGDLDSRRRRANAGNTLRHLLGDGRVVPIINENDSVAVEELRFGDNDRLSAEVAMLVGADLLILLTSADGLLDKDRLVPQVRDIDKVLDLALPTKGKLSMGGMRTKLLAVKDSVNAGILTVIANGRTPGVIADILAEKPVGTRFFPCKATHSADSGYQI